MQQSPPCPCLCWPFSIPTQRSGLKPPLPSVSHGAPPCFLQFPVYGLIQGVIYKLLSWSPRTPLPPSLPLGPSGWPPLFPADMPLCVGSPTWDAHSDSICRAVTQCWQRSAEGHLTTWQDDFLFINPLNQVTSADGKQDSDKTSKN